MRAYTMARLAAPMLLCIAGAAQAASAQDDDLRVVGSRAPVLVWRAAVARDIGANLSAPRPTVGESPEGMVKVMFSADARGRIDRISVVQPSSSPALDRAAVIAVSRMGKLRAAPAGLDATRSVEAWVYFANTQAGVDRYQAQLLRATASDVAVNGGAITLLVNARG